jgi:hypothetical protein
VARGIKDFRRQHQTVDPTGDELVAFPIWDRQTYTSATTLKLVYFTQVRQLIRDGNLQFSGGFPQRIEYLVQAIRVVPVVRPDQRAALTAANVGAILSRADDLAQIYNDGVLQFFILSKNYGQFPLFLLLPGTGIVTNNATLTTTAQASNYVETSTVGNPDNRSVFTLLSPVEIPSQTAFSVTIEWAAALTLAAGNLDLQVVLDGKQIRPKQ